MPAALYTLPYAELKPNDGHVACAIVDPWVNDLDDFPPLSLKPAAPTPAPQLSCTPSSSAKGKSPHMQRDWEVVEGVEFGSHDDDDWEDIDYGTTVTPESFARTAAMAGMDHDRLIPIDKFLVWPKQKQSCTRRYGHLAARTASPPLPPTDARWEDTDDNEYDLETHMYDARKSQSRKASRRMPYLHRQRQQALEFVLRRHMRMLPKVQERYTTRRLKDEQNLADVRAMRAKANEQHRAVVPLPRNLSKTQFYRALVVYELRQRGVISDRDTAATADHQHHSSKEEQGANQAIHALLASGRIADYGYGELANDRPSLQRILARYAQVSPFSPTDHRCKNAEDRAIYRYTQECMTAVSYQPEDWRMYQRILEMLYRRDSLELAREESRLKDVLDHGGDDPLELLFRTLSRGCFTPRDRNMRKRLIRHYLEDWKQMSQRLPQEQQ